MTTKLKLYIGRKIIDSFNKTTAPITPVQLKHLIQVTQNKSENDIEMNIPLNILENHFGIPNVNQILKIVPDEIIENIKIVKDRSNRKVSFKINKNLFIREVIENGIGEDLSEQSKKIVVEFSSPNIAKPFHFGHLRSTIIGNFISNINEYLSNKVVRLNYLGDWGTQFGLIKVGLDKLNYTTDSIKEDPLKLLYNSYVYANKLAETDPTVLELARQKFNKLESGSVSELNDWKTCIKYTVNDLQNTYGRLGVTFDEYNYESMYGAKDIQNIVDTLRKKKIIEKELDGKEFALVNERKVSLIKSDGSTLYLTRDIAAAIDRFKKFNFDQMYYVVDTGQNDHFQALRSILHQMDMPWASRIKHIKFGRIRGMSTRKGTSVFLKDILDECRDLMAKKQIESPNTKVPISNTEISDILGVSCVIINDLKQRRQKDYDFSWDKVLQIKGDSGVSLQYTHCRLCSLEKNCGVTPANDCIPELLDNPEALVLIKELGRFHETLHNSKNQQEACILVTYLFHLCNHINRAFKVLRVKGEDSTVASQRLLLFKASREVLRQGMIILGLNPLTEM